MADQKLIVHILGDDKDLIRAFKNSTNAAQRFTVGMGTIVKGAVGFLAVQKGAELAGGAIRAGINEFVESAKVTAQTNAALKSTGNIANVTASQVETLAGSLSRLSGIDDELIQRGENLLLTFKNVRNEVGAGNAIFDRATKAAVDLSVAGFGAIETTAKQLGKALNDPVRGMTALARAGVTFTEAQRDQIKSLVETGRVLEAQRVILAEVESQVGGSARALGETLPGKLNILRETFKNVAGEVIGRFEPSIKKGADAVVDWLSKTENQERIQRDIAEATKAVTTVVTVFVAALKTLRDILEPVVRLLGGLENAVKALLAVMVASKIYAFAAAIRVTGTAATATTAKVTALRASLNRLALIGAIAIPIEIILNRETIDRKVTDFLRGHGLGFLTGAQIEIPANISIAELQRQRDAVADLKGENDLLVIALDKVIDRMGKIKSKKVKLEVETVVTTTPGPGGLGRRDREGVRTDFASSIIGAVEDVIAGSRKALEGATEKVKRGLNVEPIKQALVKQRETIVDLAEQQREATERALEALQARQFRALGLSRTGEEIVPGVENLRKQLASLSERLVGSDVTSKLTNRLAGVRKILTGQLGKATEETRKAIRDLFEAIRGEFDKEDRKGPLTKTTSLNANKILEGLGLGRDLEKELRARLSSFNSAGVALAGATRPTGSFVSSQTIIVENHNTTTLDGDVVGRNITRSQQKNTRRNPRQKRGPNGGI